LFAGTGFCSLTLIAPLSGYILILSALAKRVVMSKKGAAKTPREQPHYEYRDIVLAKVRGYPPWPSMVRRNFTRHPFRTLKRVVCALDR